MGLGEYDIPGEYCDPHTASSVFLILILHLQEPTPHTADQSAQRVGICTGSCMLYGHIREVSLTDYFLEQRVVDQESELRPVTGGLVLPC